MSFSFSTPSTVQVATQSNWVASNAVYDLRKPYIDPRETKSWGSQDITGLFDELKGGKNYVEANFGRHFEEDRLHTVIHATGVTVAALGAVTYTIVAGDTVAGFPTVQLPYIATGTAGFPSLGGPVLKPVRIHEVLVFPGDVRGKVTAILGSTFTATPTGSVNLPTTVATDEIWNLGISTPEGFKEQISPNNWREHVVYWNSEIMADAHETTGTAMVQATWIPFTAPDGSTMYNWWFKGQMGALKQFRNYRELKWVFGQSVTNATTLPTNYSAQYQQTSGLLEFASSFGNIPTYDLTTGLTLDSFGNIIIDTMSKNAASTENCFYESISVDKMFSQFISVEMQNGAVQYDALGGTKDAYIKFDFKHFEYLSYTFHRKVYSVFNDPTLAGNVSSVYKNFAFMVPLENNMYQCVEKKDKVDCPPMRINFLKQGSVSREMIETLTGGAIGGYTDNGDYAKVDFRSENGAEFFGANRFLTLTGENL